MLGAEFVAVFLVLGLVQPDVKTAKTNIDIINNIDLFILDSSPIIVELFYSNTYCKLPINVSEFVSLPYKFHCIALEYHNMLLEHIMPYNIMRKQI